MVFHNLTVYVVLGKKDEYRIFIGYPKRNTDILISQFDVGFVRVPKT